MPSIIFKIHVINNNKVKQTTKGIWPLIFNSPYSMICNTSFKDYLYIVNIICSFKRLIYLELKPLIQVLVEMVIYNIIIMCLIDTYNMSYISDIMADTSNRIFLLSDIHQRGSPPFYVSLIKHFLEPFDLRVKVRSHKEACP